MFSSEQSDSVSYFYMHELISTLFFLIEEIILLMKFQEVL